MFLLFSLLLTLVSLFNFLVGKNNQISLMFFFSPTFLSFVFISASVILFYLSTKSLKPFSENYELKKIPFENLDQTSTLGMIISKKSGEIIYLNGFAKNLLKIEKSNDLDILEYLQLREKIENDKSFLEKGETTLIKLQLKLSDEPKILNAYIRKSILDEEPIFFIIFNDISETKKLLEIEHRYKALLNAIDDPIVLVNKYGLIEDCNNSYCKLIQMNYDDLVNKNFIEISQQSKLVSFLPEERKREIFKQMRTVLETGQIPTPPIFKGIRYEDGKKVHFLQKIFKVEIDKDDYLIGSVTTDVTELQNAIDKLNELNAELENKVREKTKELHDTVQELIEVNQQLKKEIEERIKLENELRKNQENYQKFIENLPVGVYRSDRNGNIIFANTALAKILGCKSVQELKNYKAYSFYRTIKQRDEVISKHLAEDSSLIKVETEMITKDGRVIFVNDFGKATKTPETGEVIFDGIIIDVTEKSKFEKDLKQREKQLRELFERLNDILLQISVDGKIEIVSPAVNRILGYSPNEITGKNLKTLLGNPEWFDRIKTILSESNEARNIILEFKNKKGETKFLRGDFFKISDEETGRESFETLFRDVTEELEIQNYMNATFAIFRAFNQETNIYETIDNIVKALQYITIIPNFIFGLIDHSRKLLKILRHNDRYGFRFQEINLSNSSNPLIDSIIKQKISVYKDNELDNFWGNPSQQSPTYLVCVPLISQNEVLGAFAFYTYSQAYKLSKVNLYYINSLAEQISLGLKRMQLAEQLKIQLKLFEILIESIPYPIYYRDLKTKKYRLCNSAFELFAEKPKEEIIGKTIEEVFPSDLVEFTKIKDEEILKIGEPQNYQVEKADTLGNKKTYISIRSPIILEELGEMAVVGILIDITERLNYENELRNALEYNKMIINLIPSGIFTIDNNMNITSWNRQAEIITGYKEEEIVGKRCFLCEKSQSNEVCEALVQSNFNGIHEKLFTITNKQGNSIILNKKASVIKDVDGNIIGVIEAFEDVTQKFELEQRLSYLAETNSRLTTISSLAVNVDDTETLEDIILPVALQITNSEGICYIEFSKVHDLYVIDTLVIYDVSGKTSKKQQITFEKFINSYCGKVFIEREPLVVDSPEEKKLFSEIEFLKGKRFVTVPLHSGEELYGLLIAYGKNTPYSEEEVSSLDRLSLIFATNLDRIKYQTELQELIEKQFQINELRSNFINLVSHEYRTPLQAIILSVEILKKHLNKLTKEEQEKQFQRIENAIKDMSIMIENVIQYNKLTQPYEFANYEMVEPKVFYESLVKDFILYYQDKAEIKYSIKTEADITKVDMKLIQLIFSNLISNSVKYSQPNPVITINIEVKDEETILQFTDNGVGIHPNEISKIFEPFYRGKNTKTIAGTGLGLSIVSNAVRLLGGEINVESKIGEGSTFIVKIPNL